MGIYIWGGSPDIWIEWGIWTNRTMSLDKTTTIYGDTNGEYVRGYTHTHADIFIIYPFQR